MKYNYTAALALTFASLFAGQAMATNTSSSVSRAQVQAELAEAVRTGNVIVDESGLRLNEMFPHNYPDQQTVSTLTREQVQAELDEAVRTGNIITDESGLKQNEIYPHLYPTQQPVSTTTREQVRAELAEAKRNGQFSVRITP